MKLIHKIAMVSTPLLLFACASTSQAMSVVPDWNMPGIPDAGFGHFQDSVRVTFARNGQNWKLTATETGGTSLFQEDPTHAYSLSNTKFMLTANFDSLFHFTGGNMQIKGKIPESGVSSGTLRWNANLTGFGVDINPFDGSPIALGFETRGYSGRATQLADGSPQSVYLFDPRLATLALDLFNHHGSSLSVNATALTTVPVPAAVWLLGSGLIALFGVRRKEMPPAEGDPSPF